MTEGHPDKKIEERHNQRETQKRRTKPENNKQIRDTKAEIRKEERRNVGRIKNKRRKEEQWNNNNEEQCKHTT